MSFDRITLDNLKSLVPVASATGGYVVLITDRYRYWQRDLDRWVPDELEEMFVIASSEEVHEQGFPHPLAGVLIDGKVPRTAFLDWSERNMYPEGGAIPRNEELHVPY